jgi:hypothetical protein
MVVAAMLARCAIEVRAAFEQANRVLARHLERTVEIAAAVQRAHASAALLRLSATEPDAAFCGRSACAAEPASAAVRIEAAPIVIATIVVAATEQYDDEQRASRQDASPRLHESLTMTQ